MKEKIKKYLDSINLNDYDLGGIEITEEDIEAIESKVLEGRSIKCATNEVLYSIKECLEEDRNGGQTMENIIREMIESANNHHDEEMANMVYELLAQFASTFNCPSNWRDLGERMAQEYAGNDWVIENCKLWDFE